MNTLKTPPPIGYQTLVEFYNCDKEISDNCTAIESILLHAADIMGLTVVESVIHNFSPIGVSGVIVVEESHIAIHTWPEHGYIALDFFTCNVKYDVSDAIAHMKNQFAAKEIEIQEIKRGKKVLISAAEIKNLEYQKSLT